MKRFFLGFLLGIGLTGFSLAFIGVGHGTVGLLGFSSSLLGMLLDLGLIIPIVGTPLLWGFYFLVIPDIDSRVYQLAILTGVLALHLTLGFWFMYDNRLGVSRAYEQQPTTLVLFFMLLAISFGLLIISSVRPRSSDR